MKTVVVLALLALVGCGGAPAPADPGGGCRSCGRRSADPPPESQSNAQPAPEQPALNPR